MKSELDDIPCMDGETEATRILEMCEGRLIDAMGVLERQFNTLHNRAQVLFSFCGIVITVTGFSGRLIAGTNTLAQILIVAGLAVVIGCAFYIYHSVMTLRWTTQRLDTSNEVTVLRVIRRRNLKTACYKRGGYVLFIGIILYGAAIAIMLLNPVPLDVPSR
ncbi:hypothetical protein G0Q06_12645 [Puniceicoccales bacterium CK1056]|uniref:Uncharacterized protein n=1 Tax=Oceanipulchritudo coccoides TaxID=2706888 RepID=A0A6B2M4M5_9BACT|nr:hypothetical protein [Oceanipulchritudo coccoides]NDV63306.1 hypothetical protein [Oceanipulchritudo coccoides]